MRPAAEWLSDPAGELSTTSGIQFGDDGVEVDLQHVDKVDWSIWISASDDEIIVGGLQDHQHFWPYAGAESSWTSEAASRGLC